MTTVWQWCRSAFSASLHTDVVETALRRAVALRDPDTGPTSGVIFHADRGCQYTSTQMAEVAEELGVRQSVGRTGVCWDNAQQESFWFQPGVSDGLCKWPHP